jgi:hypothetical protein
MTANSYVVSSGIDPGSEFTVERPTLPAALTVLVQLIGSRSASDLTDKPDRFGRYVRDEFVIGRPLAIGPYEFHGLNPDEREQALAILAFAGSIIEADGVHQAGLHLLTAIAKHFDGGISVCGYVDSRRIIIHGGDDGGRLLEIREGDGHIWTAKYGPGGWLIDRRRATAAQEPKLRLLATQVERGSFRPETDRPSN